MTSQTLRIESLSYENDCIFAFFSSLSILSHKEITEREPTKNRPLAIAQQHCRRHGFLASDLRRPSDGVEALSLSKWLR